MKLEYAWKDNFPLSFRGDAQEIGERIVSISEQRGGSIVPADIVEDARNQSSPLHPNFEWDDAKAAHLHRIQTARNLMGAIIVVKVNEEVITPVRAYVHVKQESAYMPVQVAMSIANIRLGIIADALREYKSWYKRYRDLEEFGDIIQAIEAEGLKLAA